MPPIFLPVYCNHLTFFPLRQEALNSKPYVAGTGNPVFLELSLSGEEGVIFAGFEVKGCLFEMAGTVNLCSI